MSKSKTKTQLPGAVILRLLEIRQSVETTKIDLAGAFKHLEDEHIANFYGDIDELIDKAHGGRVWSSEEMLDDLAALKDMGLITVEKGQVDITSRGLQRLKRLELAEEVKQLPQVMTAFLEGG